MINDKTETNISSGRGLQNCCFIYLLFFAVIAVMKALRRECECLERIYFL